MKKAIVTVILFVIISLPCFAQIAAYLSLGFEYSYDTNVFSDPLPTYDSGSWLNWRRENPFLKRHSLGFALSGDYFFQENARVGLSTALSVKFPIKATTVTPIPEDEDAGFAGEWNYHASDSSEYQKTAFFGALGPVFRASFGPVDLGVAVRLSIGFYDAEKKEIVVGLQAEPYLDIFMNKHIYMNLKFTYDAHLMRFIESETQFFDQNYQMLSIAPSIGVGVRF